MNPSERLLKYITQPEGNFGYFDIDDDYLKWVTGKEDFDPIEDRISFCESIGDPCIICLGDQTALIPELAPKKKIISENDDSFTQFIYFDTPIGQKGWTLQQMKDKVVEKISESTTTPVSSKEDFYLFHWFRDSVKKVDFSGTIRGLKMKTEKIGSRALSCIFVVPPYELFYWVKRQDMFLLYFDYPDEYNEAMNAVIEIYDLIFAAAKKAGVQLVFYGAPGGTEFTSPGTWENGIIPTTVKVEELLRKHGLYSIFHCCGKVKTLYRRGFANKMRPAILETLSAPPAGDVDDLAAVRKCIDPELITHGNIDLTFLRDSTRQQVRDRVVEIFKETKGYPHLMGAADSCLWPGTPPENIKAACEVFDK
jgi:hypothetical protein